VVDLIARTGLPWQSVVAASTIARGSVTNGATRCRQLATTSSIDARWRIHAHECFACVPCDPGTTLHDTTRREHVASPVGLDIALADELSDQRLLLLVREPEGPDIETCTRG
jgi:hypothetical protein